MFVEALAAFSHLAAFPNYRTIALFFVDIQPKSTVASQLSSIIRSISPGHGLLSQLPCWFTQKHQHSGIPRAVTISATAWCWNDFVATDTIANKARTEATKWVGHDIEERKATRREKPNINLTKYEEAVRTGYSASYREFLLERRVPTRKHQSCLFVSMLNLDKGIAQKQFIHFTVPEAQCIIWQGDLIYGGQQLGHSRLSRHQRDVVAEEAFLCLYFDQKAGLLRFRRKDRQDSKWSVDLIAGASRERSWRPFLRLAHAEGYLRHCPAGYTHTLDHKKLLDDGYYLLPFVDKAGRTRLRFKTGRGEPLVPLTCYIDKSQLYVGQSRLKTFPYIDKEEHLRLWNFDTGDDIRFYPGNYRHLLKGEGWSGTIVKNVSPKFFELAQSLGYWKYL